MLGRLVREHFRYLLSFGIFLYVLLVIIQKQKQKQTESAEKWVNFLLGERDERPKDFSVDLDVLVSCLKKRIENDPLTLFKIKALAASFLPLRDFPRREGFDCFQAMLFDEARVEVAENSEGGKGLRDKQPEIIKAFIVELKKKYGEAYGNDFTKLINSLRNGTDDANTELYRFHELSDTQPISMLELPQGFADNPNIGRLAYALKSFGLKQVTLIHNNIIKRAKGGDKIGATKEALKYASFIGIAGGTIDEVKGVFGGEAFNAEDIPDRVIENLTSLMFINKYSIGDIKKGDMSGWIGDVVTPPLGPLEAGIKEVSGFTEERDINDPSFGDDLLKTMPVMGRILYDWYLGGREKAMDKRSDEQQADLRGE